MWQENSSLGNRSAAIHINPFLQTTTRPAKHSFKKKANDVACNLHHLACLGPGQDSSWLCQSLLQLKHRQLPCSLGHWGARVSGNEWLNPRHLQNINSTIIINTSLIIAKIRAGPKFFLKQWDLMLPPTHNAIIR